MGLIDFIGFTAAACTTLSWAPQIARIKQTKDTRAISLSMQGIFAVGTLLWLVYGLMTGSTPVIAANAVAFLFVSWIIAMKLRYG